MSRGMIKQLNEDSFSLSGFAMHLHFWVRLQGRTFLNDPDINSVDVPVTIVFQALLHRVRITQEFVHTRLIMTCLCSNVHKPATCKAAAQVESAVR